MQSPYLYQTLHTQGYRAPQLENHCRVLEYYYGRIYGHMILLNRVDIARRIESQLRESGAVEQLSTHVELRLYDDKHTELIICESSIYEGYTLRCYSPFAICQRYDNPFGDYPSSARRAASQWAHHLSKQQGGDISLRLSKDDVVCSCGESPLFGVRSGHLFSSPAVMSVERSMGVLALQRCGYKFVEEPIFQRQLALFDELFYIDAYGVTAIAQVEDRLYMSIVSNKIAQQMGENNNFSFLIDKK